MTDKSLDKKFESIRFHLNPLNETLLRALDHVRHFIIAKKLILVGGMSVDCSLRLHGKKLYDDDQIPDYDFYSPENVVHAYQLASELCNEKFPNVDVVPAIHTTTMKVRVDGNVVADITYIPQTLFARLKVLEYKGMQIIHPWYVMMDQFRSLSTPYENPPNEVIFERWSKDVTRLNMLYEAYPIGEDDAPKITLHKVDVPEVKDKGVLQGWAALAWHEHHAGISGLGWTPKQTGATAMLPVPYCSIMTTSIDTWLKPFKPSEIQRYNALFSYPRYARTSGLEIFDMWGERITVEGADKDEKNVVSLPALMYYFLHVWLLRNDETALAGVVRTKALLKNNSLRVCPYGDVSWNQSTLYSIANIIDHNRVKNWKPAPQTFDGEHACKITRHFDTASSPLFAIDGAKCDNWITIVPSDRLRIQ